MNILVTGATGYIGSNIVREMSIKHNLYILVRPKSKVENFPTSKVFIFNDNISLLSSFLNENKIDGVIHLASSVIVEHKPEQIKDLILSNIYLGTAILEACVNTKVRWFLNTGTIWQNYNSPDYEDKYNPVNLYAATKQAFMIMAKYYTETSEIRFCTLKLCDTYGPGDTRRKVMSLFEEIAKSGATLDMSPGEQKLDLLHIDDVVKGFETLANLLNDKNTDLRDEYVLSSGKQISLKELAAQYEKEHNVKLNINWGGRPYRKREVMKPYIGNDLPIYENKISILNLPHRLIKVNGGG